MHLRVVLPGGVASPREVHRDEQGPPRKGALGAAGLASGLAAPIAALTASLVVYLITLVANALIIFNRVIPVLKA